MNPQTHYAHPIVLPIIFNCFINIIIRNYSRVLHYMITTSLRLAAYSSGSRGIRLGEGE